MTMTESEIVKDFKEAKNKRQQIDILADLNATTPDVIKTILRANGVDLRSANSRKKVTSITRDFPVIEAADPVPGEIGYKKPEAPQVKEPPLGVEPRIIAEMMFNESRIRAIVEAMSRYYADNMAIPEEWRTELKERL